MSTLREYFITTERPYKEGTVEVFEMKLPVSFCKKATLTITALGVYEVEIGGEKITNDLFTPGFTYYPRDLQYQTYDITKFLQEESTMRVYLGQGWYCGRFTYQNKTQIYGDRPAVSWILEVETEEGFKQFTSRDESVYAVESPYLYAGLYDGVVYDANGNKEEVYPPVPYTGELPEVIEPMIIPVKVQEETKVKEIFVHGDTTILDFGQNFAGIVCIHPDKMQGNSLKLRHAEILKPDGSLYTTNLRKAKAEIVYTKSDNEKRMYQPAFTYMGFRYVELSGVPYVEGLLEAHAVYSDMKQTGDFTSGNEKVNQVFHNQMWGMKSNYIEVPTDCPQRDERMGYTGDAQVYAHTAMYNYDVRDFWKKFLKDIRYSQMDNGMGYVAASVPTDGPEEGMRMMSMIGWSSCDIIVPWKLYMHYGDISFLENQYASMKTLMETEKEIIKMPKPNLGDWLMVGKDMRYMAGHHGPVTESFVINDLKLMSQIAQLFDEEEESKRYQKEREALKEEYILKYIEKDGSMKDDYQGAYVMALVYVLDEKDALYSKVYAQLVSRLKEDGIGTGFFATEYLLPLLVEHGHRQLAYDLLLQENCPGWMYQVNRGATTIWERWNAIQEDGTVNEEEFSDDNMVSFNHYAFGSIGEFYYRYILGIKECLPGFEKIHLKPYPDKRLGEVNGYYDSVQGRIRTKWKYRDNKIEFYFEVPCKARIELPDGTIQDVEKGGYTYECEETLL